MRSYFSIRSTISHSLSMVSAMGFSVRICLLLRTAFSICSFLEFANAKRPTASTLWSSKISCSSDMILDEGERFLANSREAGSVSQIYAMSHRPLFCISSQYICPILPNPIKPTFIFMVFFYILYWFATKLGQFVIERKTKI